MADILRNIKKFLKQKMVDHRIIDPFRRNFKEIEFETTAYCNRKCSYCPQSKSHREGDEGGKYMRQEVFEKLVQDLKKMGFKGNIAPHLYGEPMSDPRLLSWIKYMHKELPHCPIKIVTNGDYLNEQKYREFIDAGVSLFNISKHGEKLSQGATELLDKLDSQEKKKRIVVLDYFEDYKTEQSMLNSRGGDIDLKKEKKHPEHCLYVTYPVINSFGNMILCCNDYYGKVISGNIMERNIKDIWFDGKNVRLRRRIYRGIFDLDICKNCWI